MNKADHIARIRERLRNGAPSVGSWMQLPNSSVAEIMGRAGYEWVAVDLEHGSFSLETVADVFRALELGDTLPFARIAEGTSKDCKQALEAGAAGIVVPMVESAQLREIADACRWPPAGTRGVGFSRANLFGKNFDAYAREEARAPMLIAMIEHRNALEDLDEILAVPGLDAVFIGPYDLSASMGRMAEFEAPEFGAAIERVCAKARQAGVAHGLHVVDPVPQVLRERIEQGHQFLAYSIDAVLLHRAAEAPFFAHALARGSAG